MKNTLEDRWDAKSYSQFLDLRTRPAKDLLSAIPDSLNPKLVYDLGCGPGNSTILLKNRWPEAEIIGLDSSEDMLNDAQNSYPDIKFMKGDIADFSAPNKIDCIFANASLQWVPNHPVLIPKLFQMLNKDGVLGIQMPNNFHLPSHQVIIKVLETNPAWKPLLKNLFYGILTEPLYKLSWYYDLFTKSGAVSPQLWETTYYQEMSDHRGIFDWVKGTGLRPILTSMDSENQTQFAEKYIRSIEKEYPFQANNKLLLPFNRIFMIAVKT